MALDRPAAGSLRQPDEETFVLSGADYPDEVFGDRGVVGHPDADDAVSMAVGVRLYVERPGRAYLPWATKPGLGGRVEDVEFDRFYVTKNLLVDVFPSLANLDPATRILVREEVEMKAVLCEEHGVAYVSLYEGQPLDTRVFTQALHGVSAPKVPPAVPQVDAPPEEVWMRQAEAQELPPPSPARLQPPVDAEVQPVLPDDALSVLIGAKAYHMSIGPPELPWAWRILNEQAAEWAKEPLVFSRFYWQIPLLVDMFPSKGGLRPGELERLGAEIGEKSRLCKKQRIPYLVLWGGQLPTREEIEKAIRRYKPREQVQPSTPAVETT